MTTDEDWRAPGTPAAPSPVLTDAIERLEAAYDALFSIAPTTLSDEDLTRLACEAGIVPAVLGGRSEVVIHDDRYTTTRHPNGKVSFHRRT